MSMGGSKRVDGQNADIGNTRCDSTTTAARPIDWTGPGSCSQVVAAGPEPPDITAARQVFGAISTRR